MGKSYSKLLKYTRWVLTSIVWLQLVGWMSVPIYFLMTVIIPLLITVMVIECYYIFLDADSSIPRRPIDNATFKFRIFIDASSPSQCGIVTTTLMMSSILYEKMTKQDYIDQGLTITESQIRALNISAFERLKKHDATIFHPTDGVYYIWDGKLKIEEPNAQECDATAAKL